MLTHSRARLVMAISVACVAGALATSAAGEPFARGSAAGPAMFEAGRTRAAAAHAGNMEPSDPRHQNVPSPDEVMSHFRAKGWSESKLSQIPATEIATSAANVEQEFTCPCGCPRQSIYDCNCRTAAELRGRVLDELARLGVSGFDLTTDDGRSGASSEILRVLASANGAAGLSAGSQSTSTFVFAMVALGLVFVVVVARRRSARRTVADSEPPA